MKQRGKNHHANLHRAGNMIVSANTSQTLGDFIIYFFLALRRQTVFKKKGESFLTLPYPTQSTSTTNAFFHSFSFVILSMKSPVRASAKMHEEIDVRSSKGGVISEPPYPTKSTSTIHVS